MTTTIPPKNIHDRWQRGGGRPPWREHSLPNGRSIEGGGTRHSVLLMLHTTHHQPCSTLLNTFVSPLTISPPNSPIKVLLNYQCLPVTPAVCCRDQSLNLSALLTRPHFRLPVCFLGVSFLALLPYLSLSLSLCLTCPLSLYNLGFTILYHALLRHASVAITCMPV